MIKVGDKYYDAKCDKEFVIAEIIHEDTHDWFIIQAKNVTFKGKLYETFRNSMNEDSINNGIIGGYIKKIN